MLGSECGHRCGACERCGIRPQSVRAANRDGPATAARDAGTSRRTKKKGPLARAFRQSQASELRLQLTSWLLPRRLSALSATFCAASAVAWAASAVAAAAPAAASAAAACGRVGSAVPARHRPWRRQRRRCAAAAASAACGGGVGGGVGGLVGGGGGFGGFALRGVGAFLQADRARTAAARSDVELGVHGSLRRGCLRRHVKAINRSGNASARGDPARAGSYRSLTRAWNTAAGELGGLACNHQLTTEKAAGIRRLFAGNHLGSCLPEVITSWLLPWQRQQPASAASAAWAAASAACAAASAAASAAAGAAAAAVRRPKRRQRQQPGQRCRQRPGQRRQQRRRR